MKPMQGFMTLALLASSCMAQCYLAATEQSSAVVNMRGWVDLPTGAGDWSVSGDLHNTTSQRHSGTSTFFISDFELGSGDFLQFTLRAGEEDGLVGFAVGLPCLPRSTGSILECDNEMVTEVVWGRGTEDTAPGLCAQVGRFPSLLECPVAAPLCSEQCSEMNAAVDGSQGYGPGLPVYASQAEFHSGFLTCCDRFCDNCGLGLGWIADETYTVVVRYSTERLLVFVNNIRLFDYVPSVALQPSLPSTSRFAFATKSHADVDFGDVQLLSGGTVGCPADPWTAVQLLVVEGCSESARLTVDYGDGSVGRMSGLGNRYELSHVFRNPPPQGLFSVVLTLNDYPRQSYKTIHAYVREPLSIGIRAVPLGACGFSGACHAPYGEIELDYVLGGSSPYTIVWSSGRQDVLLAECSSQSCSLSSLSSLQPGEYTATVTDSRGCLATSEPVSITVSSVVITGMTQPVCGSIEASVSHDARCSDLFYSWWAEDDSTLADPEADSQSGLPPGTYGLIVTDVNSCSDTSLYTLSYGVTNYFAGDVIVSSASETASWGGYPRFTEGTVSLDCPDRSTRIYYGDLHDITSASFLISGGASSVCSITVTATSGCVSTVSPIYYCLHTEYDQGVCPPQGQADDYDSA